VEVSGCRDTTIQPGNVCGRGGGLLRAGGDRVHFKKRGCGLKTLERVSRRGLPASHLCVDHVVRSGHRPHA
jgi:hypothetical protein